MIPIDEVLSKINSIMKHDLKQDPDRAHIKLQCISYMIDLFDDETYFQKVENLFQYDLDQNPSNCLKALESINLAVSLEEDLSNIIKNTKNNHFDK